MSFSSENLSLTVPVAGLSASVADYAGTISVPAFALLGTIDSLMWAGELTAPGAELAATLLSGQVWVGDLYAPAPTLAATIISGQVFDGALLVSTASLTAALAAAPVVTLTAPQCVVTGLIYPEITWNVALTAPTPEVYASWAALLAATFDTWVLNARTLGASSYTAYPFTSYFRYNGSYYGCAADGVYLLTGDDDAGTPIDAHTLHGISDFGNPFKKWIDSAYLNVRGLGSVDVAVRGEELEEIRRQVTPTTDGLRTLRAKFGRALEGRNWQLGVYNVDGSRFTLTNVRLTPIKLSRRV